MIQSIKNNQTIIVGEKNLCILLSGTITVEQHGKQQSIPSKTFFFFEESFEIIAASPFLEGFVLRLDIDFLNAFPDVKEAMSKEKKNFSVLKIKNIESIRSKVKALQGTYDNPQLRNSYLHILWSEIINDYEKTQKDQSIIDQFSDLIEQNLEKNYCAGTYAEMMDIPLKTLINEVKKREDKTPCNLITEKVINSAKYKLLHTDDTSQMIAYQLGFEDPYYFIKYFKKNTQLTPTQFRKQLVDSN